MSQSGGYVQTRKNQIEGNASTKPGEETDISKELKFREKDGVIFLSWTAIPQTEIYKINVKRKGKAAVDAQSKEAHCELQGKDHAWETGEVIIVDIFAKHKQKKDTIVCKDYKHVVGGDRVPGEFIAKLNEIKPSSSIDLKWYDAREIPQEYEILVHENPQDESKATARNFSTSKTSAIVHDLKPSTEYSCLIVAKYPDKNDGNPILSNIITTAAENTEARQMRDNETDLTTQQENRNLGPVVAADTTPTRDEEGNEFYDAPDEQSISRIENRPNQPLAGQPRSISGTKFEEAEDSLIIEWNAVPGAEDYILQYERINPDETAEKNTRSPKYKMARSAYGWKIGETVIFVIKAVDKNAATISESERLKYIIGGDTVPSNVTLHYNGDNSYQSLKLKWNKAKKDPEIYEVTVYDSTERVIQNIPTITTSLVVEQLEHLTTYHCVVKAKYAGGKDGKPVWSNALQTQDLPAELYKVQRVWAMLDPVNRIRQIVVKWEAPKKDIKISHYEVCLIYNQNQKTTVEKTEIFKSVCFKRLTSNTEYTACVVAVPKKTFARRVKAFSEPVTTDPAESEPGFQIEKNGRPIITKCNVGQCGDDVIGKFEWTLPDFGIEKNNYEVVSDEPSLKEGGQVKVALDVEEGCKRVKPVRLRWGKTYSFTVKCAYRHYDTHVLCDASITKTFNTGIGKPSIDDVTWLGNRITVNWSKGKGVKKHFLKVFGEGNKLVFHTRELKNQSYSFSMENLYGRECIFVIEASGEGESKETAVKTVLIGGDKAATKVVARKDAANPRRSIIVEWVPPKLTPQGYRVILYEIGNEKQPMKEDVNPLEPSQRSHKFVDLKTSTTYCVRVCPIYDRSPVDGSLSNCVDTDKRINLAAEAGTEFGQTEKVMHAVKAVTLDDSVVELSWSPVQIGENYRISGYRVLVYQKGVVSKLAERFGERVQQWTNTTIFKDETAPKQTRVDLKLKKGEKYDVKVSTLYFDLDTDTKTEAAKDYEIFTDPSKTTINDCGWNNGVIYFSWQSVRGAKKYQLIIKDEFFRENLVDDQISIVTEPGKGCSKRLEMSEELRIGRTCMTKVIVFAEGERTSETDWKAHLIGGAKVARNVKASRNTQNPKRCVTVTFDCPIEGPAPKYKIVAVPEEGMKKILFSKSGNVLVEYLRKGIKYKFEVYARWENEWSEGSLSNSIFTDGDKAEPVMDVRDTKDTTVDLTNAILAGQVVAVNVTLGKDFGQVQDLRPQLQPDRNKDMMTLHWNIPTFDNKSFDYKVEKYKVEVWKKHKQGGKSEVVDVVRYQQEYVSKPFELDLGETYQYAVSTIYLDIDQDYIFKSSAAQDEVHTRPCVPVCTRNVPKDNALIIEWNAATGALRYEVELYTESTSQPTFRKNMEKKTVYERQFDEDFGYGSTYCAKITAIGADNKSNFFKTEEKIIGGDRVPTQVAVTSNHPEVTDPNTQIFLSWVAPQRAAKSYSISSFPREDTMVAKPRGEECLVSGLKAGTEYYFQVKAVHEENGKDKLSGGCSSKRIQTNPTPTKVEEVWTKPGPRPSTSVEVSWKKVSAAKEKETTKYRVHLTNEENTTKREINVQTESVIVQDLNSGTSYSVTVAGGNSIGYGKDSEKHTFKTDLGTPKNVLLQNDHENPSSSLVLNFSDAEGTAVKYIATLHKFLNHVSHPILEPQEVQSGHIYDDLEPNNEYQVDIRAVFAEGEGKSVKSNKVMTAPSKTKIEACGCTGSREIFAKWSSEKGCDYHELWVICGPTYIVENQLFIENKNDFKYSCLNEATLYIVKVRSRNASGHFGNWSDEKLIYLVPAKLKQITAALEENEYHILVQCQVAKTHSPFYFMQAMCGGQPVSEPIQEQEKEGFIKWRFPPPETAQKYTFELWAEDADKVKGKNTTSNPVISRPIKWKLKTVKTNSNSPSTDIEIEWEKQDRCDSYEINICRHDQELPENRLRTTETSCRYRCQSPGDTYLIAVRAIRENVKGEWSDNEKVSLVPSEIDLIEDPDAGNGPVTSVVVKWKPLKITPAGYVVKLFCDGQEVTKRFKKNQEPAEGDDGNQEAEGHMPMQHIFRDNLKPGSLCYCTVAAYNDKKRKIIGRESKSQNYRIKWLKADNFLVTADENEPSRRAKLTWEQPMGVDCFKLEIENKQTGFVTTMHLRAERYVFDSGIPGNVYTGRLYCGRDERYDTEYVEATITMKPAPPTDVKVVANEQVNGLTIEFKDPPSIRKEYEITADALTNPEDKIVKTITQHSVTFRDLVPGESYKVSVVTIIGESRSNTATSEGYISTFPEEVKNIRSKIENGSVLFEWDKLDIKPDKYIVQWRVDNEPITDEHTQASTFMIFFLKPAHCYSVRVMAENSSGIGPMSLWENFITDPSPPYNVNVYPDPESPETSLIVKFQDEKDSLKRYRITAKGRDEEPKIVVTHEHFGILTGLKSGREYMVTVQTLFCGKESTGAPYSRI